LECGSVLPLLGNGESGCSFLSPASAAKEKRRNTAALVRLKARADREVEVLSGQSTGCPKMKVTASSRDGVGSNRMRTASP
jgi:hypothetical protein